jgi:hypothetical protein
VITTGTGVEEADEALVFGFAKIEVGSNDGLGRLLLRVLI